MPKKETMNWMPIAFSIIAAICVIASCFCFGFMKRREDLISVEKKASGSYISFEPSGNVSYSKPEHVHLIKKRTYAEVGPIDIVDIEVNDAEAERQSSRENA